MEGVCKNLKNGSKEGVGEYCKEKERKRCVEGVGGGWGIQFSHFIARLLHLGWVPGPQEHPSLGEQARGERDSLPDLFTGQL